MSTLVSSGAAAFLAALAFGVSGAAAQNASNAAPPSPYRAARGDIDFALTGDAILTRPLSHYAEPAFLEMVEALRGAEVAFTNIEIVFQEVGRLTPMVSDGESYMFADPSMAGELAWAGFDIASRANNHTLDYGWAGMRATSRALDEAGIAHAGVGENLALAGEATYVETAGGRVGLISTASTFEDFTAARPQRRDIGATPGLNPIRYEELSVLPRESFEQLRSIAAQLGESATGPDTLRFHGETFAAGEEAGVVTRPDPTDLARILASIRAAERQADWVIVATHTHEGAGRRDVPADFLVEYARAAIDAGADIFVGTGPHVLRGIEIYRGRPIFYSLGNFIFENETVRFRPSTEWQRVELPADARTVDYYDERQRTSGGYFTQDSVYWESVIALPAFEGGALREIRLLPVTLGFGTPRSQRGRPLRAGPALSRKIIERLAELSAPFGTEIRFENGVGIIRPAARTSLGESPRTSSRESARASPRRENGIYARNIQQGGITVEDDFHGPEFEGVPDPRVHVEYAGISRADNITELWTQDKYTAVGDPIAIASWDEAQLIIAEAEGGSVAVDIINRFHARAGLPAFSNSDPQAILDHVIVERGRELFLESHHLGDKIRYDLPFTPAAGAPYPPKAGGFYGDMTCFPLPAVETMYNPNIG